ncbi:Rieske (2Fe-2S) protein [Variovorax atrisoli]|uniref:Rieske (2Fe-2S) protein n=1 Tax=Variovorax atrisoli TaxID=3394203 RepID=UPI0033943F12
MRAQSIHPQPAPDQVFVVGHWYHVPCVFFPYLGYPAQWWPVIGPRHTDERIIGFSDEHFHVDIRFVTKVQRRIMDAYCEHRRDGVHTVFASPIAQRYQWSDFGPPHIPAEVPTIKRKQCKFVFPDYTAIGRWHQPLEDAYECAKMTNGICPHQGAPLYGLEVRDGVVTCPLHGLRWSLSTGELVRRTLRTEVHQRCDGELQ